MRTSILGGRVVDPASGIDRVDDLHLADGLIASLGEPPPGFHAEDVVEAEGLVVCPGLVDLCARLREPGCEHKATIRSETRAALAGGITTLCIPPDTEPVIDEPSVVELINHRNRQTGVARLVTIGAMTIGLRGDLLSEMAALKAAGCVGVGNALEPIRSTLVMRRAMEYAATYDMTVFLVASDPWLSDGGHVHEGAAATRLGLQGIPVSAETAVIARDLALVEEVGVRAHFCRLSSARSVEMIGRAREEGLPVSADVSAHQLHLTEAAIAGFDALAHVLPPLRTFKDREALRGGVRDGWINAICSDHQPHETDAKLHPFEATEPGISSLETLLPLALGMTALDLPLDGLLARVTSEPARILGLQSGTLGVGAQADICVFDPHATFDLNAATLQSRGRNTPFHGSTLRGQVMFTLVGGERLYTRA